MCVGLFSRQVVFFERNFSLSLGYTHNFDRVCDNANTFAQFDIDKQPLATSDGCFTVGTDKAYLLYFPGLMLLITVLCVNFLGDGLRDALDPKQAGLSA